MLHGFIKLLKSAHEFPPPYRVAVRTPRHFAGPLLAAELIGRVVGVSDGSGACNQLQMK
jgi:hypothetical protein